MSESCLNVNCCRVGIGKPGRLVVFLAGMITLPVLRLKMRLMVVLPISISDSRSLAGLNLILTVQWVTLGSVVPFRAVSLGLAGLTVCRFGSFLIVFVVRTPMMLSILSRTLVGSDNGLLGTRPSTAATWLTKVPTRPLLVSGALLPGVVMKIASCIRSGELVEVVILVTVCVISLLWSREMTLRLSSWLGGTTANNLVVPRRGAMDKSGRLNVRIPLLHVRYRFVTMLLDSLENALRSAVKALRMNNSVCLLTLL